MGTANSTLLRKVGDYSLSSPALWTLCSLCRICSTKFKDQMGSPELQPVFNRNVSMKGSCWNAQRDKSIDFSVSFTVDAQQMLGLRLEGKWDSAVCALLIADILAGGIAGKLQFILQRHPRAENVGQLRAETQARWVLQARFRSGCNVLMLTWH